MSYFLTKEDWVEIAYALEDKLKSPVVQGDGSWVRHIRTIQDIIGPDGENMSEETPAAAPRRNRNAFMETGKALEIVYGLATGQKIEYTEAEEEALDTVQDFITNNLESPASAPRAFIYVDGGIVQAIACDTPLDVFIIDYDIEGMEDEALHWIDNENVPQEAFVQHWDGSGIDKVRPFEEAIETAYKADNK